MAADRARLALAQATMDELCGVLGYAEGLGLIAGALGAGGAPATLLASLIGDTLAGRRPWGARQTFPEHLRGQLRDELTYRIWQRCVERGAPHGSRAAEALLAAAQLGSIAGILEAAHRFGEAMAAIRVRDGSTVAGVVALERLVRARLGRHIADVLASSPRPARDTAPLRRVPGAEAASEDP